MTNDTEPNNCPVLLDCTFRDGGYYNAWDFEPVLTSAYLKAMTALPVDVIEIGLRTMPGTEREFKGGCAYCTDEYIGSLELPENAPPLAVMVNGSDLLSYPDGVIAATDRLFAPASDSPVNVVRVACHIDETESILPAIPRLHELGYTTTVQLMQIAGLSAEAISGLAKTCAEYPIDVLYFADSLGSMNLEDVDRVVSALKAYWHGELGFHAHNNMERAVSNSIRAIELGVRWIDGTVMGMGRGPGNARTEYLAIEFASRYGREVNHAPLLSLIEDHFKPLQEHYNWGPNPYYYMAGKYGIHPTYVQMMLDDSRFEAEDMLAVVNKLRNVGGKQFKAGQLEAARFFYGAPEKGVWSPATMIEGKTVLVLGSGPGARKYRVALENYINKFKPLVIALNKQTPIAQHLITLRAACHPVRLLTDYQEHLELPQPLITAASMLPEDVRRLYRGNEILDYGLTIEPDTFEFHENNGVLPNASVITYVLALLASGRAERALLAGFDGYMPGDPRHVEMEHMFCLYMAKKGEAVPLLSVTPTNYNIPQTSIFELCA